jgi:hypothetical protein
MLSKTEFFKRLVQAETASDFEKFAFLSYLQERYEWYKTKPIIYDPGLAVDVWKSKYGDFMFSRNISFNADSFASMFDYFFQNRAEIDLGEVFRAE